MRRLCALLLCGLAGVSTLVASVTDGSKQEVQKEPGSGILKTEKVDVQESEAASWRPKYASLRDFTRAVMPPRSHLIASAEDAQYFYAAFGNDERELIFVKYGKVSDYESSALSVTGKDREEPFGAWKTVVAMSYMVTWTPVKAPERTNQKSFPVWGRKAKVNAGYVGVLTFRVQSKKAGTGEPLIKKEFSGSWPK